MLLQPQLLLDLKRDHIDMCVRYTIISRLSRDASDRRRHGVVDDIVDHVVDYRPHRAESARSRTVGAYRRYRGTSIKCARVASSMCGPRRCGDRCAPRGRADVSRR
jgi:hypothetical protein